MLSLLPTSRADIENALENGRAVSFGRATAAPSSGLPPCFAGLASDLVIVGLLQMVADAKAQAARDSATIDTLRSECAKRGQLALNLAQELGDAKQDAHNLREQYERI